MLQCLLHVLLTCTAMNQLCVQFKQRNGSSGLHSEGGGDFRTPLLSKSPTDFHGTKSFNACGPVVDNDSYLTSFWALVYCKDSTTLGEYRQISKQV